jgi:hypothetical protein
MKHIAPLLLIVGCATPIQPDPTGSGGSSSSATTSNVSASASSGTGGTTSQPATFTGGSRLKVRKLTADDGSTQQLGFHDTMRNENCVFRVALDGRERCLPDAALSVGTYSDAQCTQPILVSTCSTMPPYFLHPTSNACPDQAQYAIYQVTGFTTAANHYVGAPNGSCAQVPTPPGMSIWISTMPLAPSEFVGADEGLEP